MLEQVATSVDGEEERGGIFVEGVLIERLNQTGYFGDRVGGIPPRVQRDRPALRRSQDERMQAKNMDGALNPRGARGEA